MPEIIEATVGIRRRIANAAAGARRSPAIASGGVGRACKIGMTGAIVTVVGLCAMDAGSSSFAKVKGSAKLRAPVATLAGNSVPTCATDLTRQLKTLNVPGLAAVIVKNGQVLCTTVAGMANVEQKRPVTPDTLFLIASVSKTVTATALMQLYDQGKFRLDDNINDYLPFKVVIPSSPASIITIRQLLTHTSSIKDNPKYINCARTCNYRSELSPFVTRGADSPISLEDFVRGYLTPGGAYYDRTANFEARAPGTYADYSNMGIVVVGYLVELLSGMPFDRYCQENIFAPLGMSNTSWRLAEIEPSILAMPYNKSSSGFFPYGHFGEPDYPDGMLRTSVLELADFLIAIMQGGRHKSRQILQQATVQEMLRSQTPLDRTQGLVWMKQTINGRTIFGHDGADNGTGAQMWFDPAKNEGVIIMTNGVWNDDVALLQTLFEEADRH